MADIDINTGEVVKEGAPSYRYDPRFDIKDVNPMAFVDIHDAYVNHNVPTNIVDDIALYNQIESPDAILGTPRDIFEAYRMFDHAQELSKSKKPVVSSSPDEP